MVIFICIRVRRRTRKKIKKVYEYVTKVEGKENEQYIDLRYMVRVIEFRYDKRSRYDGYRH